MVFTVLTRDFSYGTQKLQSTQEQQTQQIHYLKQKFSTTINLLPTLVVAQAILETILAFLYDDQVAQNALPTKKIALFPL